MDHALGSRYINATLSNMIFNVTMVTVRMTFLIFRYTNIVIEMDEFIHWPKPNLLLLATCDEMLLQMIDNWMKNHLISDNNCNIVTLFIPQKFYKE